MFPAGTVPCTIPVLPSAPHHSHSGRQSPHEVTMPSLTVRDSRGNEIPAQPKVAIGSLCNWKVSSPDGALVDPRWVVTGAILDYHISEGTRDEQAEAYVLELTTRTGDTAQWYWARTGR